jgi:hypothetical protein
MKKTEEAPIPNFSPAPRAIEISEIKNDVMRLVDSGETKSRNSQAAWNRRSYGISNHKVLHTR